MRSLRVLGLALLVIIAVRGVYELVLDYPFLAKKLSGKARDCPWWHILRGTRMILKMDRMVNAVTPLLIVEDEDAALDIVRVSSPRRTFWIKRRGEGHDGPNLLAYLLAEHQWMEELSPAEAVKPGDMVLDCGAHVGVFTHTALAHGAVRVLAVEPDPVNLECLRRNFRGEIESGRVVVIPKAVWNKEGMITLVESTWNSGSSSAVLPSSGQSFTVSAITIDRLASDYGRIDYIKMDIEGAEREALAGARQTLRRFKPRLAIESYHLPDDGRVLPSLIRSANPAYSITCGVCGIMGDVVVPYVLYAR